MKKYAKPLSVGAVILALLAFVFWWGGNSPGLRGWNAAQPAAKEQAEPTPLPGGPIQMAQPSPQADPSPLPSPTSSPRSPKQRQPSAEENRPGGQGGKPLSAEEKVELAAQLSGEAGGQSQPDTVSSAEQNRQQTTPAPTYNPPPVNSQDTAITDTPLTCTLSVRCDTIRNNMAWLAPDKAELVPADGIIFAEQPVTFYQGETVFHLLLREMKRNRIHLEFVNTPLYNSAYIEGIHNLYEFDCGELSGWMYKVNGWFPNYGCSRYQLQQGDRVEWVYTCDLGADVGGLSAAGGQRNE